MDASGLEPTETVPASRKLGRSDALALAKKARRIIVSKGKKVDTFDIKGAPPQAAVEAMLGPTGNLRAPTIVAGRTVLVGFNEEQYESALLD